MDERRPLLRAAGRDRRGDARRGHRARDRLAPSRLRGGRARSTASSGVQRYAVSDGSGVHARRHVARAGAGPPRRAGHQRPDRLLRAARRRPARARARRSSSRARPDRSAASPARSPGSRAAGRSASPAARRSAAGWSTSSASTRPSTTRARTCAPSSSEHAPDGVDVFFDNVGGEILEHVLARLARGARVVLSGAVSQYNATEAPRGPSNYMQLLVTRSSMTGFVIFDYAARYAEGVAAARRRGCKSGELRSREDVVEGDVDAVPRGAAAALPRGEHRQARAGARRRRMSGRLEGKVALDHRRGRAGSARPSPAASRPRAPACCSPTSTRTAPAALADELGGARPRATT